MTSRDTNTRQSETAGTPPPPPFAPITTTLNLSPPVDLQSSHPVGNIVNTTIAAKRPYRVPIVCPDIFRNLSRLLSLTRSWSATSKPPFYYLSIQQPPRQERTSLPITTPQEPTTPPDRPSTEWRSQPTPPPPPPPAPHSPTSPLPFPPPTRLSPRV